MLSRRSILFAPLARPAVQLYTGTYGLQSLAVDDAIEQVRKIGYDGLELCLMPGWPSEPSKLDSAARRRIRDSKFPIPSLMESLHLTDPDQSRIHDRLRAAAALGHDVGASIVQSVPGGVPDDWDTHHSLLVRNLIAWARVAEEEHIRLAIKAHLGHAVDTPRKLVSILEEVHSPALVALYDYSHYEPQRMSLEDTLSQVLPHSVLIAVKDGRLVDGKPRFLLPGQGTTDYSRYFRLLRDLNWTGWMLVEISRQLQVKPGYDGIAAVRQSYSFVAGKLRAAGLR